jgi:hypothetical protein
MSESKQYMNARDDSYEPDAEDFALMIAKENEVTCLRSGYHEADRELRNCHGHTDRQLRGYYKEKKSAARHLARVHHFDVVSDCFEIEIADDVIVTAGGPFDGADEDLGDEAPPTRKDKRRAKTERRRAERYLRFRRAQWEKSRATSVVRKTGALLPVVAAM